MRLRVAHNGMHPTADEWSHGLTLDTNMEWPITHFENMQPCDLYA
jgi:hypothetical protein